MNKKEINKKKISFISAIFLVLGSTIGAGIFLKNGEILGNVGESLILTLISWFFSIIAVICMGISLSEIASADTKSNLGIISWVKTFCHKYLYKFAKNFMAYLYLPINFFIMPYYAIMMIQDAFGWQTQWWVVVLISFGISAWFFIVSGISASAGNIQNLIITSVKFIPVAFCAFVGFILFFCKQSQTPDIFPSANYDSSGHKLVGQIIPMLGIIGSIPAIMFSFDGFYTVAGIQSEMKEPHKTATSIVVGLVIVSIIDIIISISLLLGSFDGRVNSLSWFTEHNAHWVIAIIELIIGIGIFGIINSFAIYNPRYYEDLIKINDLPFSKSLKNKLNSNKPIIGLLYSSVITIVFFIVLTIIGLFGYTDTMGYRNTEMVSIIGNISKGYDSLTGNHLSSLYSFCDLMANWTGIIIFLCLVFALIGGIINRKTNKIKVNKVKGFLFCSYLASVVIIISMVFILATTIGNIPLAFSWKSDIGKQIGDVTYEKVDWLNDVIGSIITLVVLIIFVIICCVPSYFEIHNENKLQKLSKTRK